MEVIKHWLTQKLGLSVSDLNDAHGAERALSNGILISEILRKYTILSDDEVVTLRHSTDGDARHSNMALISKWLENTGMNSQLLNLPEIANELPGYGLNLLFKLYFQFEVEGRLSDKIQKSPRKVYENGDNFAILHRLEPGITPDHKASEYSSSWFPKAEKFQPEERSFDAMERVTVITPYDRMDYPTQLIKDKPFLSASEMSQAQRLYFSKRSIEIIQHQELEKSEFARKREIRKAPKLPEMLTQINDQFTSSLPIKLDSSTLQKLKYKNKAEANRMETKNLINDMNKFDAGQRGIRTSDQKCTGSVVPETRANFEEYELKVMLLKCKRQSEILDRDARSYLRRSIMNQLTQSIPLKMAKLAQDENYKVLDELSTPEHSLALYFKRCKAEKDHFVKHALYSASQIQDARLLDLRKEQSIEAEATNLREYAASELLNPPKHVDSICDVLEDEYVVKTHGNGDDVTKNMSQLSVHLKLEIPPPPPCTPNVTARKKCKEVTDKLLGPIMICEDDITPGETDESNYRVSICRVPAPLETAGEAE